MAVAGSLLIYIDQALDARRALCAANAANDMPLTNA